MNSGNKRALFLKQLMTFQDQVLIISHYLLTKLKILNGQRRKVCVLC